MTTHTCEYGVHDQTYTGEPYVRPCGEPAIALWDFGGEVVVYVCEEHDEVLVVEEADGDVLASTRHELLETGGD